MSQVILEFLEGDGVDHRGRKVSDILAFTHEDLECDHEFIQWLFPLLEPSQMVPSAPCLEEQYITLIKSSITAQVSLENGLLLMSGFYRATRHWLQEGDHNHRRITRIIKSTDMLLRPSAALSFYTNILSIFASNYLDAPVEARRMWKNAIHYDWSKLDGEQPGATAPQRKPTRDKQKIRNAIAADLDRTQGLLKSWSKINRGTWASRYDRSLSDSDDQSGSDAPRKPLDWTKK